MLPNDQALNPDAAPFTPHQTPAVLSPIIEEKKFEFPAANYYEWTSMPLHSSQNVLKLRQTIFVSANITRDAVRKNAIKEFFATESCLFYYLRWTCRMQVIDAKYKLFQSTPNTHDRQLVLFNSDLHSSVTGATLYIVGTQNDARKQHAAKWKMTQFMTADEIYLQYQIDANDLGQGCRPDLYKKVAIGKAKYMNDVRNYNVTANVHKITKLEQIRKKPSTQPLHLSFAELFECITDCIGKYELIPIIWFDKKEQNAVYRYQMLLPVQLRSNNWIGIAFDYNGKGQLMPVTICVDYVDIHRKLALFEPLTDGNEYLWFSNNISEIKATSDDIVRLMCEKDEKIEYLQRLVCEKDKEIERMKGRKDTIVPKYQ